MSKALERLKLLLEYIKVFAPLFSNKWFQRFMFLVFFSGTVGGAVNSKIQSDELETASYALRTINENLYQKANETGTSGPKKHDTNLSSESIIAKCKKYIDESRNKHIKRFH